MDNEPARGIEQELFRVKICAKIVPKNLCYDQTLCILSEKKDH